jgi:hypothetical protein
MKIYLTKDEYKKLVIDVAIAVSPLLIERKPDSVVAGEHIALYARDIADAVEHILKSEY